MRINVFSDTCIASGMCHLASPEVFGQRDADGSVEILQSRPSLAHLQQVREAVKNCPVQVFIIEDEENVSELTIVEIDQHRSS